MEGFPELEELKSTGHARVFQSEESELAQTCKVSPGCDNTLETKPATREDRSVTTVLGSSGIPEIASKVSLAIV
eukprot:CAMPEP_0115146262 /NCGR_PEP_ID=MMETSP0227-20121206/62592_1 /TAXON_ID=89957 /ORGANISM="Polarella glacialis, Strain CCMP 1383" /LENGTH=73 /DNA_ID=CAMNT_0002555909 /DNA_START=209 /DNA_END=430 /DNA_ORIENTATION=+